MAKSEYYIYLSILYIFFLYLNHYFLLAYKVAWLRLGMQGFPMIRLPLASQLIQQRLRALFFW